MAGIRGYGDTCLMLPVELRQCQLTTGCTCILHHACQIIYKYNNGITSSDLKMICKDCIGQFHQVPDSNSGSDFLPECNLNQKYPRESAQVWVQ